MANYRPVQTETRKALDKIAREREGGISFDTGGPPKLSAEFEASLREGGYYEPYTRDAIQDVYAMGQPGPTASSLYGPAYDSPYQESPWKIGHLPQTGPQIGPPVPPQYERPKPHVQR